VPSGRTFLANPTPSPARRASGSSSSGFDPRVRALTIAGPGSAFAFGRRCRFGGWRQVTTVMISYLGELGVRDENLTEPPLACWAILASSFFRDLY
jgi:hypothetical protein